MASNEIVSRIGLDPGQVLLPYGPSTLVTRSVDPFTVRLIEPVWSVRATVVRVRLRASRISGAG